MAPSVDHLAPLRAVPGAPAPEPVGHRSYGLERVTHAYGSVPVLTDVSCLVRSGEVHGLVGANGAGKSTVVKLLSGALRPLSGGVVLDGEPVRHDSPADAQRLGVVTIHQDPQLFGEMDVAQTVYGVHRPPPRHPRTRLVDWNRARREAATLLDELEIDISPRRRIDSLGLAEQRLVEIAAATARRPRFLLLDEVTASLESESAAVVLDLARRLAARGTGICVISHRLQEVTDICDRVTVLREGRVVGEMSGELKEAEIVQTMLGDLVLREQGENVARDHDHGPVLLEARSVELPSTGTEVSVTLHEREILGVTGALGSGAPDLVRVLAGVLDGRCDATLRGARYTPGSPRRTMQAGVSFLSGDRRREGVMPEMSIAANMALAALSGLSTGGFVPRRRIARLAERYRAELGIRMGSASDPITSLSGGNQQKVLVARTLSCNPTLMCIDEPTQGVDIGARVQIHDLLRAYAAGGGAVLVFSSDPEELIALCDRVAVIRNGAVADVLDGARLTVADVLLAGVGGEEDPT